MSVSIEHLAGEMDRGGVQVCTRCGEIITDYRGVMVPDGTPPLRGFAPGPVYTLGRGTSIVPMGDDTIPCAPPAS